MKKIVAIFASVTVMFSAAAQSNFNTGYFLDNYCYGYRINPAIDNPSGFVGLLINNVSASVSGNVGMSSFLYPSADGSSLVTGLHNSVSASQFLGNIQSNNRLSESANLSIFAFGAKRPTHDYVVDLNVRNYSYATIPGDVFHMLKSGSTGETFDLSRTNANVKAYVELGYLYNRQISDKITIGGKVKLLMGLGSLNVSANRLDVALNSSEWTINTDAQILGACSFVSAQTNPGSDIMNFKFRTTKSYKPSGWGAGVDLGVVYKPIDDLSISAAVVDLGFISWTNNIYGINSGITSYKGVSDFDLQSGDLSKQIKGAFEQFKTLKDFHLQENPLVKAEMLPWIVNVGARYKMPFYRKLSAGLLASFTNYPGFTTTDIRIGATVTPLKWFCFNANLGFGTFGSNVGTAITLDFGPLNIYFGGEFYLGKYGKINGFNAVPLSLFHDTLNAGLTFTF